MGKRVRCKGILMVLVAALMLAFGCSFESKAAVKSFAVKATVESKTKVKLSWKKKSVSGYEIYRAGVSKSGKVGRYKRIATVSGKKVSYVDKVSYKKTYLYKVKAYKKSGNKKTYKYEGVSEEVYAGVGETSWGEYMESDAKVSTESIELIAGVTTGMKPTGYEIYRSVGPFYGKRIAKVKAQKDGSLVYEDKNVVATMTYSYKIRAYKKVGSKTIYGKYSKPLKLSAVNFVGKYQVSCFTEGNQKVKSLVVSITSEDAGNADMVIDGDFIHSELCYSYKKADAEEFESVNMVPVQYSYDNETWYSLKNKEIVLKAGKTVYLTFESEDGSEFFCACDEVEVSELTGFAVGYNDLRSYLDIDLKNKTAETRIDGELYH